MPPVLRLAPRAALDYCVAMTSAGRLDANERAARTAREVKVQHAIGGRKKRRRVPRQVYPRMIETDYAVAIRGELRRARAGAQHLLDQIYEAVDQAVAERAHDSARGDAKARKVAALVEQARRSLQTAVAPTAIEALATRFAERTSSYQREQLNRQTRAALGADVFASDKKVPAIVDGFVAENVALVRSLPDRFADDLSKMVTRAVTDGTTSADLADQVADRFGVSERHASLIARDQIGKVYGQLNASRQEELGVEQFVWRTVHDERVRDAHDEIDGETYDYPEGHPTEGLPGEPIQCRCYAEPVFDSLLAELDDLEDL